VLANANGGVFDLCSSQPVSPEAFKLIGRKSKSGQELERSPSGKRKKQHMMEQKTLSCKRVITKFGG